MWGHPQFRSGKYTNEKGHDIGLIQSLVIVRVNNEYDSLVILDLVYE